MRSSLLVLPLVLCLAAGPARAAAETPAAAKDAAAFAEGFETEAALAGAVVQGKVAPDRTSPYKGAAALTFSRAKADMEKQPTSAALRAFPVRPGVWNVSAALRSRLYSPDSSYNGTVALEVLDASGKTLEKSELGVITGTSSWQTFRKRLELPAEAASARFVLSLEKSYGDFSADDLSAAYAGPVLKTVTAIKFASAAVGNLFLPDQLLRFSVTAECTVPRPEAERVVTCVVRDYWGAEFTPPLRVVLTGTGVTAKGRPAYGGVLDLSGQPLETGKYYEIHAEMSEPALPEPARDTSTFAVLPLAVTKAYKPFDIPFTASGWNPGVPGFFPLCDRLGMRVANVYSRWSSKPPYAPTAPGIEIVKSLGMGALLSTPVHAVETRGPGYEAYDETALREGAKRLVSTYKDQLPIAMRIGNEPHPVDDADAKRMIAAYKALYEGFKAADPNVLVLSTSAGPEEIFFRNGYQPYHDAYDFHQYADAQSVPADFAAYERMVKKYGQRKPIWSTEIGLNSQGMSRAAVAEQMVKIFTNFFACGGVNVSWFGVMWPDPDAKIVGSNGDSFDVFNSKYCLYSPKLTAISEYNMVNAICIKKVVEQKAYPGKLSLTLFRDRENRCLLVAWSDAGRREVFLPLPGVGAVRATRLDGSAAMLDAAGRGLTLALSNEPYLLEFTSAEARLPAEMGKPQAAVNGALTPVVKGGSVRLALRCAGLDPAAVELTAPPRWTVRRLPVEEAGMAAFTVTAPAETAATEGRLVARLGAGAGELLLPLPVADVLDVRFLPLPATAAGAGMNVEIANRGQAAQTIRWKVSFPAAFPMNNGTFKLGDPAPFTPAFAAPPEGEITVAPGAAFSVAVRASNLNPHSLYRARLEVTAAGRTLSRERYVGGGLGVPKVKGGVTFDGKLGDPAWKRAVTATLDEAGQYAILTKETAGWDGVEDLSGTMHLLWDDQYLYLGMEVKDDIFSQPKTDSGIWCGDGLQFLVDPCRAFTEKPGKYDYAVSLSSKGPQAWCYASADAVKAPSGEVKDFRLKITPSGHRGGMVYEVAIPWNRVSPFVPAPGADLGLAMIINEDDGRIRDSFMSWFGCAHSKQLDMNGDLILLGE